MAGNAKTTKRSRSTLVGICAMAALCLFAVLAATMFVGNGSAQGADQADSTTLGIGSNRSTVEAGTAVGDAQRLGIADSAQTDGSPAVSDTRATVEGAAVKASTAANLKTATTRTITVKDPDPVVVLAAVDLDEPSTVAIANTIGTATPLPTAPHLKVDTSGSDWMTGMASGYDVASSSTHTRSGRLLDDDCVTVAVPQGQENLLGHAVEIVYGDQVVIATVTDTGGFASYGRVLDLAGGVWKAFGCEKVSDWGVRTVSYRFL